MRKETIYIPLPKNISFSVFEALKTHVNYFKNAGFSVVFLSRNKKISSEDMLYLDSPFQVINYLKKQNEGKIYAITVIEVFIASFANLLGAKKEIIFWVQGLIDEEDFLSQKKRYRYLIYNFLLKKSLSMSNKIIVVTNHMHKILVDRYKLKKSKKYLVLNCNSRLEFKKQKKIKNSLCYIGGLSKWQNVDKMLVFFNQLVNKSKEYTFYIATFDHKKAKELIVDNVDKKNRDKIKLVSVKEKEEVEDFLNKMEFGFLIRDNILLNNVASPIKLAEYLSCGVNPIISNSLVEFTPILAKNKCGIIVNDDNFDNAIEKLLNFTPVPEKAVEVYNQYFERKEISNEFNQLLQD